MTIDTNLRAERIVMHKQLYAILVLVLSVLAFYRPIRLWLQSGGVEPWLITVVLIVLYLCYRLYFRVRKTSFIYASDTAVPGFIRIRHFELKPLNNSKLAIELPQRELYRFEVTKSRGGLLEQITLWQRRGAKIFQYAPFSITILNRKERQQLLDMLTKHSEKKQRSSPEH